MRTRTEDDGIATRNASQNAIAGLAARVPELIGGSADLSELQPHRHRRRRATSAPTRAVATSASACASTPWAASPTASPTTAGCMPYVATFLPFSDYMRGSVRLAALSRPAGHLRLDARLHRRRRGRPDPPVGRALRGPAGHPQPDLRAPRRPQRGLGRRGPSRWSTRSGPVAMVFTRQKLPVLPGTAELARDGVRAGGYVLAEAVDADGTVDRARAHPPRDRLRAAPGHGRARGAHRRGPQGARRVDAQLGALRGAAGGLPRRGPAAAGHGARVHRGGRLAGLGSLGRPARRRHHRHRPLRRERPAAQIFETLRLHRGARGRGRPRRPGRRRSRRHLPRRRPRRQSPSRLRRPARWTPTQAARSAAGHRRRGHRPGRRRALGQPHLGQRHQPLDGRPRGRGEDRASAGLARRARPTSRTRSRS